MPIAVVNGIEISYADSGGDGPAVVLSHGFLMDASMFDAQLAALAPEYRVITWDARGHGGTLAPGPFSYWDLARDALALLNPSASSGPSSAACLRAASSACAPRCWRHSGCGASS
jgi:pimeloyl-ACP methyl ester carboxylesterase